MRVAYYCVEPWTLSWARRLHDEGHDVLVYIAPDDGKLSPAHTAGQGIVARATSQAEWLAWGTKDDQTLYFFDTTSAGAMADTLRGAGKRVVGGGGFCDRLESDRTFGTKIAQSAGIVVPPTHEFSSVSDAVAFIKKRPRQEVGDGGWAWKSHRFLSQDATVVGDDDRVISHLERLIAPTYGDRISAVVQERVKGVAISTARWWNGKSFVGPFEGAIEHKKFMNGDIGATTGCAMNVVWFYPYMPKIAYHLHWEALEAIFRARSAPPCLYDINAVVTRDAAYFLEWTPRLGGDSETTSQRGIENLGELLGRLARGGDIDDLFDTEQMYASVRLSVPPYPYESKVPPEPSAKGVPVEGIDGLWRRHFVMGALKRVPEGLAVADPYGMVGIAMGAGSSLRAIYEDVYAWLKKAGVAPSLQYRTDAAETLQKDIDALGRMGYSTMMEESIGA